MIQSAQNMDAMTDENQVLKDVIKKFPDQHRIIGKLFHENEVFREICEDYALCLYSIKRMQSKESKKDENLNEFTSALNEIEKELRLFIESNNP